MRILRIVGETYPELIGGLPLHAHALSYYQAKIGHNVKILSTAYSNNSMRQKRFGYDIIRYKAVLRPFDNPITPLMLKGIIEEGRKSDIVHAHSHLYFSTVLSALAKKFNRKPLVITNHGVFSQSAPHSFQYFYLNSFGKFTLNKADIIICYTNVEKKILSKIGVEENRILVIHNGVNANRFTRHNVERENYILWVGRLKPLKGVNFLIRSFGDLLKYFPEMKLKLIGQGSEENKLKYLVKKYNIEPKVEFIKNIPNNKLPYLYNKAKIFVLPSLEEGMPRVLLEALGCGTPTICSRLDHIEKAFSNSVAFFEPGNVQDMTDKIIRTISDDKLSNQNSNRARKIVKEKYSWSDTVKKINEVCERLID